MSPKCEPSDVLLHADVAIGTHRCLLSIAAALLFFMSPAGCQGFCFHGHTAVWCNKTQNPSWVSWRDTNQGSATAQQAGTLTDWLTSPASHSTSWANNIHDPRLLPQALTGRPQLRATEFHNDSAIYYTWWICRNVLDRKCLLLLLRRVNVCILLCVCSRIR